VANIFRGKNFLARPNRLADAATAKGYITRRRGGGKETCNRVPSLLQLNCSFACIKRLNNVGARKKWLNRDS